jgi:hypothetical protein
VVAEVGERLSVSKRAAPKFHVQSFNLKKLNDVEVKERYQAEIPDKFAVVENLVDYDLDINKAWAIVKIWKLEPQGVCTSQNIIRVIKSRMGWVGQVVRMGEMRYALKILIGKPKGKRPLGRPRRRCEDSIGIYLKDMGWEDVDWIHLL